MSSWRNQPRRAIRFAAAAIIAVGLFYLGALLPPPIAARDVDEDFQQWLQVLVDGTAGERLRWSLDLQGRWMDAPRAYDAETGARIDSSNTVVLVRPGVGWALSSWLALWGGYAYQPQLFENPDLQDTRDVSEHRTWEQLSLSHRLDRWHLGARTRLEQRFRNKGPGDGEWAHRFRQQARAAYSLTADARLQLIISDEFFFHLNDTDYPSRPGLDQNRAFLGVGYRLFSFLRLEIGYLNQFVRRFTDPHQLNHILSMHVVIPITTGVP